MKWLKKLFHLSKTNKVPDKIQKYIITYLPAGSEINIIDIGAHKGSFTDDLEKYYNIKRGILIEPIPQLAEMLKNKYPAGRYHVYQNAVSDMEGQTVDFLINEFAETSSLLKIRSEMKELADVATKLIRKEKVVTITIDSITDNTGIEIVDFIKLDVQGAEHLVISGAKKTLSKTKLLWIELSFKPLYQGSSIFHQIYELLEANEFVLLEISPGHRATNRELLQVDALFANLKFL